MDDEPNFQSARRGAVFIVLFLRASPLISHLGTQGLKG